jgi:hypothetical protein
MNKLHNYPVKLHLRRICHISFTKWQMRFTVTLSDKYASGEASQDNCEAYLSFCESNGTLPQAPFTVQKMISQSHWKFILIKFYVSLYIRLNISKIFPLEQCYNFENAYEKSNIIVCNTGQHKITYCWFSVCRCYQWITPLKNSCNSNNIL